MFPTSTISNHHRHGLSGNNRQDAFTIMLTQYQRLVYRFLLRHTQQADDAMDLTQETFIQAYLNLPGWRAEAKQSTWLLGIALNLARNHANRSPHLRHVHQEWNEELIESSTDPEQWLITMTQHRALLAAVDKLPAPLKEALQLVVYEGEHYEDAAIRLAVPVGTLKSRLNRARQLVRKQL